jgi:low affinity Fe/Cu permease
LAIDCEYNHQRHNVLDGFCDPEFSNRDAAAVQANLDELIRATEGHQSFLGVEERPQEEIERIKAERNRSP